MRQFGNKLTTIMSDHHAAHLYENFMSSHAHFHGPSVSESTLLDCHSLTKTGSFHSGATELLDSQREALCSIKLFFMCQLLCPKGDERPGKSTYAEIGNDLKGHLNTATHRNGTHSHSMSGICPDAHLIICETNVHHCLCCFTSSGVRPLNYVASWCSLCRR